MKHKLINQRQSLQSLDWLGVIIVLLAILFFIWRVFFKNFADVADNSLVLEQGWYNVLTVDMLPDKVITQESILKGEDLVLVFPNAASTDVAKYVPLRALSSLGILSSVTEKAIDPQSPIYHHMRVLFFKNNRMQMAPLYRAGIRSVELDRAILEVHAEKNIKDSLQVVGHVILSNGSKRYVHLVPIDGKYLHGEAVIVSDLNITNAGNQH